MQSEEFMREYFRERTERIRDELVRNKPFREKYYSSDCQFESRQNSIEWSEKEEIHEVVHSNNSEVQIITVKPPLLGHQLRTRYHLKSFGDSWQILAGEFECTNCRGTGRNKDRITDCFLCKGKGWYGVKN
jgi:hypothetical protein